jgi:hypothetical protein
MIKVICIFLNVLLLIWYSISICGASLSDTIVKLAVMDDTKDYVRLLEKLIRENPDKPTGQSGSTFQRSAAVWIQGYFAERSGSVGPADNPDEEFRHFFLNYHGMKNLAETPGNEFYVAVNNGVLIFSNQGQVLGKIDLPDISLAEIGFLDIDADGIEEIGALAPTFLPTCCRN